MQLDTLKGNINKYILYQFFNGFVFFAPVFVIFLQSKGLNMAEILLLQSFYSVFVVIFEVPTGIFADRYGKKLALTIGPLLFIAALLVYGFGFAYWHFIIGELLAAISAAFMSGADSVFLHESLKAIKQEENYKKITGKSNALTQIAGALGNILGGLIGGIALGLTFIASAISVFIAAIVGMTFVKSPETLAREEETNYQKIVKVSIGLIRNNPYLLWLTLFFATFNGIVWIMQYYIQPYLNMFHVPVYYFGVIYAVYSVFTAVGSMLADKYDKHVGENSFVILSVLAILTIMLLGIFPSLWLFPLWFGFNIYMLINETIITDRVLKIIPADKSATILSFQNLGRRLVYAIFAPLIGLISDKVGITNALLVNAGILLLLLGGLLFIKNLSFALNKNKNTLP